MNFVSTRHESDLIDRTRPEGPWRFDESVTKVFDNMLMRSIPQYDVMRKAVFDLGAAYAEPGSTIVDCGASRGEAIAPFVDLLEDKGRCVCVEISDPMIRSLEARFADQIALGTAEVARMDLRTEYPDVEASLTLSILTLQFTPIERRQRIVRNIYEATKQGGALIVVEKILGESAELNEAMVNTYHQLKMDNGYSAQDVARKSLSLEGVLVPVTAQWNMELLHQAGFDQVDCFWRWMNFAGWIAVKTK